MFIKNSFLRIDILLGKKTTKNDENGTNHSRASEAV